MSILNTTLSFLLENLVKDKSSVYYNCEPINSSSNHLILNKNVNLFYVSGSNSDENTLSKTVDIEENNNNMSIKDLNSLRSDYEYDEAVVYLLFILFWYSLTVIALICTQTKKSELQYLEDSQTASKYLVRGTKSEHVKREVLGKEIRRRK